MRKIILFLALFSTVSNTSEFVKPKAAPVCKVTPEDVCADTLPLLQVTGKLLQELGVLQEQMAVAVSGVVENNKKSGLKKASAAQLKEIEHRQISLHKQIEDLIGKLRSFNEIVDSLL